MAAIEAQKAAEESEKTAAKQGPQYRKPPVEKPPVDDDTMRPATPKNPDDTEEISIAGRTKITVPKNRNDPAQQGSESPSKPQADDTRQAGDTPQKDDAPREGEENEAKTELNSILKRAPSTSWPGMVPSHYDL